MAPAPEPRTYDHPEAKTLLRPDVGTQASFRKKKPPTTYRYDSSLSPALSWDGQDSAREVGEWLIGLIEDASRLDPPREFPEPRRSVVGGRLFEGAGCVTRRRSSRRHNGSPHDYQPDFVVRLKGAPERHLILETKGYDPLAEVKAQAAQRWADAVNADGRFGRWAFAMARRPEDVRGLLDTA